MWLASEQRPLASGVDDVVEAVRRLELEEKRRRELLAVDGLLA